MWAQAIIAGIPNEVYWESTPQELAALFEEAHERDRNATLRSALIAATIVNVHRKKGSRLIKPSDFIVEPPRPEDFLTAEQAVSFMDRWAASQNANQAEVVQPPAGWETNEL